MSRVKTNNYGMDGKSLRRPLLLDLNLAKLFVGI